MVAVGPSPPVYLSIYLYPSIYLSTYLSIHLISGRPTVTPLAATVADATVAVGPTPPAPTDMTQASRGQPFFLL